MTALQPARHTTLPTRDDSYGVPLGRHRHTATGLRYAGVGRSRQTSSKTTWSATKAIAAAAQS